MRSSRAIQNGLVICNKRFSSIPVVEVREDKIYPHLVQQYLIHHNDTSKNVVPKQPHLRLHCLPVTGGILNQAIKIYACPEGLEEREHLRHLVGSNKDIGCDPEEMSSKAYIIEQSSNIYAEAPLTTVSEGIRGLMKPPCNLDRHGTSNAATIYEFRKYYLKLGYDTVPKFLSLYEEGLPSKLGAVGSDPTTSLITLLYTEVGQLNEVIEVWKHGDGVKAMEKSRVAARSAPEWRQAIKEIAELAVYFRSTIYAPLTSSPLN